MIWRGPKNYSPQLFTQSEINDVIIDLGLPKEKAEYLGSRLKEKNLLAAGTLCIGKEAGNRILQVTLKRMLT
jgi:hypothetical protein